MKCRNCNAELPDELHFTFCGYCGERLVIFRQNIQRTLRCVASVVRHILKADLICTVQRSFRCGKERRTHYQYYYQKYLH